MYQTDMRILAAVLYVCEVCVSFFGKIKSINTGVFSLDNVACIKIYDILEASFVSIFR
jgi:hypothetical protein